MKVNGAGFYITGGKGFHVVFENGWTVSVQFGPGNYSDHHERGIGEEELACGKEGSATAETAVWPSCGGLQRYPTDDSDTVQGWQSPADVLRLMNWAASQ